MKSRFGNALPLYFLAVIQAFPFTAFNKASGYIPVADLPCHLKGSYSGTGVSSTGASESLTYTLKDFHFIVGSITKNEAFTTFGWYRNTCDIIFIYDWYTVNNSYYILKGSVIRKGLTITISGSFKNLTDPSDYGAFTMSKYSLL